MIQKLSVRDLKLRDKKALIRVDFNVPLNKHGEITDDTRIRASIPTIQYVLDQGGIPIVMSHLGRPTADNNKNLSLAPCANRLSALLERPVIMAPDCRGAIVSEMVGKLKSGQVLLLENLRFHKGEEKPDQEPGFGSALAEFGDVYINDAFGCAHRTHTSTTLLAQFFPRQAAAGLLMQKELDYLGNTLINPMRPFCAILGGSKISTKFKIIEKMMQYADKLLIGGAMAHTFFKAANIPIGDSFVEDDFVSVARELLDVSLQSPCRLLLPSDLVIARTVSVAAESRIIKVSDGIPAGFKGLDIGPATIQEYINSLHGAETIFWNGPLGVFECQPFSIGTIAIAKALAELSATTNATTIIGGGDSVAAIDQSGVGKYISHLSTGGGATLEYIEFGRLPGVDALSDQAVIDKKVILDVPR